ncbi:MAG: Omp28-related outer membrane protein [Bacteroidetes bacterium]|nr:Omp28-related outer membrane protein [Bacteroidota bacterium]
MKKIYLFGLIGSFSAGSIAQTMNENFDGYTVGSYMGNNSGGWTTWSGTTGGAEDVQVTAANAFSGSNSIYFVGSTSGGGPQDVVVPFGGAYNTGQFLFETKIFVVSGKGAYFNFQGNTTLGQVWSLNCQMVQTGDLILDDGSGNFIQTTYPTATWFTLTLDINLNSNEWELLIDGVSQGVLQNTNNQLASIDIFPVNSANGGNNLSGFYLDDFTFNHTAYALPALNGAVTAINNVTGVAGINVQPGVTIRNLGTTDINSFDITIDYNGNQIVENVTGVTIASLETYDVSFTNTISLVAGSLPVVATISNINSGGSDGDATDDVKTVMIDPVVPATGKVVVAEEGTGTWCQWCPRGAVYMDMMTQKYPGFFAPIAVHNGDPMTNDAYDAAIGALITGYPTVLVDRLPGVDPSAIEADFLDRIVVAPKAFLEIGAQYNSTTGLLEVEVSADFQSAISGNYRLACVVTEDDVTGTGSGWSQSNAYAGGGSGEMGGYELLPNPVPAAQMVYDHVARIILPGFAGQPNSFPSSVAAGEIHTINFNIDVPSTWDTNQLNIVALLLDPSGDIDNAGFATLSDAVANGFNDAETEVGMDELAADNTLRIYPNPAADYASIAVGQVENETVIVRIFDINGRLITEKNYGELEGEIVLPVNTALMNSGVYLIQVNVGEQQKNTRLVVE